MDPIFIFQCLNPDSRNIFASSNSFSRLPPNIRRMGMAFNSRLLTFGLRVRRYFHNGTDSRCVYRSSNAISRQDFAEWLPYRTVLNWIEKWRGSFHSNLRTLSKRYPKLAHKLSRVSPVIIGAIDATRPIRPCSSRKLSNTVLYQSLHH